MNISKLGKLKFLLLLLALAIIPDIGFTIPGKGDESWELSFPKGTGAKFKMMVSQGLEADLSIYVADSSAQSLDIEYYFLSTSSFVQEELWQQFTLQQDRKKGSLFVKAGYIKAANWDKAESMPSQYLKGYDGVQVNDFLFSKKEELDKWKVGEETLTVPAGKIKAEHFRRSQQGQTVDFWIASEAKPLGLVKLVSKNDKVTHQNYTLLLDSLLKNVKAVIDPQKSIPLTEKGRGILNHPLVKSQ